MPDAENLMDGGTARWRDLAAYARFAEDAGFDSLWVQDHLIFHYDDLPPEGPWECFSLLAALAAATTRIEIGPLVACTSFRNPALTAKMADTIDEISGGRLVLGLGAGWNEPEYRAFGYPFDHRYSRFEEALHIIHTLLRTGQVDFQGSYYSARECELRPRGPRPQGPPIMLGTTGDKMLALTAKYADSWNAWFSSTGNTPEGVRPLQQKVDAVCATAGRDPATLERTVAVLVDVFGGGVVPSGLTANGNPPISGTAEQLAETLRAFAAEGVSHVQLYPLPLSLKGVEGLAPVLEVLDRG
jgi:probable F420-dependent oxidoreductase